MPPVGCCTFFTSNSTTTMPVRDDRSGKLGGGSPAGDNPLHQKPPRRRAEQEVTADGLAGPIGRRHELPTAVLLTTVSGGVGAGRTRAQHLILRAKGLLLTFI